MSQKPHTPKNKKHSRGLALGLCGVAAACLLFAGGAVVGNMAFGGNANSDSGASASTSDSAPTLQINSKPTSDSSNSSDNYDTADGMAGEDIYKKVNPSVVSVISTTSEGTGSGSGVIMSKDGYIITTVSYTHLICAGTSAGLCKRRGDRGLQAACDHLCCTSVPSHPLRRQAGRCSQPSG